MPGSPFPRPLDQGSSHAHQTGLILLLLTSLLSGCATGATPTDNGRRVLPAPPAIGYVWGNQDLAAEVAGAWLHNRGYATVEAEKARQVLAAGSITLTGSSDDTQSLVRLAPELGVLFLVHVDASVTSLAFRRPATDDATPHVEPRQSLYRVQVAVRGIDARDGSVAWKGKAGHPYPVSDLNRALTELTQRALAQAFGE